MARPTVQTLARNLITAMASRSAPLVTKIDYDTSMTENDMSVLERWYEGATYEDLLTAFTTPAAARAAARNHPRITKAFSGALHRMTPDQILSLHAAVRDAQLRLNPDGFNWDVAPAHWSDALGAIAPEGTPITNRLIADWRARMFEGSFSE